MGGKKTTGHLAYIFQPDDLHMGRFTRMRIYPDMGSFLKTFEACCGLN